MMRNLEIERLALASMSLGIAERCLDEMVQYSQQRNAFNKELHHFGQIQHMIGVSFAEYHAARAYVYQVASSLQLSSSGNRLHSDGVKLLQG